MAPLTSNAATERLQAGKVPSRSPKLEDMELEQVADAQLHIDDTDTDDADNPQLCTEYVKEIYQYMREMEV